MSIDNRKTEDATKGTSTKSDTPSTSKPLGDSPLDNGAAADKKPGEPNKDGSGAPPGTSRDRVQP